MPAFYAHHTFGEQVISYLPPSFQENFLSKTDCCVLGFQGPDILFYHKPFSSNEIKTKGMDLHLTSAKNFFIDCAKKILSASGETQRALASYVAGFICHFSLDNACHGYIYKLEDTGVSHGRIESEFDKYLKAKDGKKVRGYNAASVVKNKNGTVSKAVAEILEVPEPAVKKAMRTIKTVNGLFSSRSKAFHRLAHRVLKRGNAEKKFGGMFLHFEDDPDCVKLNPTLEKQLKNAIEPTARRIEYFFENLQTIATTGEIDPVFDKDYKGEKIV